MRFSAYVPQILLFGDSIVQDSVLTPSGLIPRLQQLYGSKYDVVNRGFAGYNAAEGAFLEQAVFDGLGQAPVEWTILFFGTDEYVNTLDFVTIRPVLRELTLLTAQAVENSRNVVIVGPGITNEDLTEGFNSELYKYGQLAKGIAELYDIPFVDTWTIFRTFLQEEPDLYDSPVDTDPEIGVLADPLANATFSNSVNETALNISQLFSNTTNTTNTTAPPGDQDWRNGTVCFTEGNRTLTVTNGTDSVPCLDNFFIYIGERGNPKNFVLDKLLIDGYRYTDLSYKLLLDALVPILNVTSVESPLPDYNEINSTGVLPKAVVNNYLSAAESNAELYLGVLLSGLVYFPNSTFDE